MDRISLLCSYLDKCKTFADVACDHGYCAEYMLKNGLCESAVISDISEKCLAKAQALLSNYIKDGRCAAVCCDGLQHIAQSTQQVLIAGIGGEEIVRILKNSFIPHSFVFQPMKNAEVLREYLLSNGCSLSVDGMFTDGRNYYFIIKGKRADGNNNYTRAQLLYGRDSLNSQTFKEYLRKEICKKQNYLQREMSLESANALKTELAFMQGVLNGEIN